MLSGLFSVGASCSESFGRFFVVTPAAKQDLTNHLVSEQNAIQANQNLATILQTKQNKTKAGLGSCRPSCIEGIHMQRVKKSQLLIIAAVFSVFVAACGKEKVLAVSDYLHDIDNANRVIKAASNNPAETQNDGNRINASAARSKIQFMNECWPKKDEDRFTTANTDHSCLDAKGYKR